MSRILALQRLPTSTTSPVGSDSSTSSGNACACSATSWSVCYVGADFAAV